VNSKLDHFADWFSRVTCHPAPRGWQCELAAGENCSSRLVRIPTGLGKTEGVLAAWSYHRIHRGDVKWPARLIWCLPMRVLVEQTEEIAKRLCSRMPQGSRPDVQILMGGADQGQWFLYPERPAILIGTQDMLLSRALNRGFASGRALWPTEFGLLNNDSLWVMDEVQLMDVGLATSAHLQAFRRRALELSPWSTSTWWMSATMQPDWLQTVDTDQEFENWKQNDIRVAAEQRDGGLWKISKALIADTIAAKDTDCFAQRILQEHATSPGGEHGKITLVVCNTVQRACAAFDRLRALGRADGLELVHSRFRPAERAKWRDRFLSKTTCRENTDLIIVATQVVEAGVDISAGCLITELAPWPSLVQRFGRCARYGGTGRVVVVDRGRDEASAAPYAVPELESAWQAVAIQSDVGIASLEQFEERLTSEDRQRLFPYAPEHLLLKSEFEELFDTTPDLTGADLDISRFIRTGNERDLQVFWVDVPEPKEKTRSHGPPETYEPRRHEMCSIPFMVARDWLCGPETKTKSSPRLKKRMRAWVWDWLDGEWSIATRALLQPGRVVCVEASCGGYRVDRGFDPDSKTSVPPVIRADVADAVVAESADNQETGENRLSNAWKTIACHSREVIDEVVKIASALNIPEHLKEILILVGRWHDWGKSHPAFQGSLSRADRPRRSDLAKGPQDAWLPRSKMYSYADLIEQRLGFRHELASALGLFALLEKFAPNHPALLGPWSEWQSMNDQPANTSAIAQPSQSIRAVLDLSVEDFDLLMYLVASHHGKVRVALHSTPKDQEYIDRDDRGLPIRGVREGDRLPAVPIVEGEPAAPEICLTLEPACVGLSRRTGRSWRERTISLQERWGACGLAFLEALFIAADRRASMLNTIDSGLVSEVQS
jgi:CRISPR-associated endonuclease/helicase Cas3